MFLNSVWLPYKNCERRTQEYTREFEAAIRTWIGYKPTFISSTLTMYIITTLQLYHETLSLENLQTQCSRVALCILRPTIIYENRPMYLGCARVDVLLTIQVYCVNLMFYKHSHYCTSILDTSLHLYHLKYHFIHTCNVQLLLLHYSSIMKHYPWKICRHRAHGLPFASLSRQSFMRIG